jgi:hypothetical protein
MDMTIEEFSSAVWAASDDLFCTPEEAIAAIEKYKQELAQSAAALNEYFDKHTGGDA